MSEVPGSDRLEKPKRVRAPRSASGRAKAAVPPIEESVTEGPAVETALVPRLLALFRSEIMPKMMDEFRYQNVMEVPRLKKVTLNIGAGEVLTSGRAMEFITRDLGTLSGQKPIVTRARKSIAGFKLREGNTIGACVTLRGARMYYFVERLFNAALPRIRDFRGMSRSSFDGRGNYSMGVREQIIFPEIDYGQIDRIRGFQVTFATSAKNDSEGARLLELMGMPFTRDSDDRI